MCDDGDACTLADTCESGICKGSATPSAVLDGDSEVPFGGDPDGSGVIALKLNAASGTVCYEFSWSHIAEPTAARILGGDPAHPAAEQVLLFTRGASHSGCVSAAPQLIAKIRANPVGYYVQIENTEIPGGALRGKLARTKPCPATDDCHLTSFCNSAGGACVAREAVNGTPCDDGDRAKAGNTCREGVCKAPPQQTATLRSGQQSSSSVADLENSFLLPNKGDLYTLAVFAYCTNGNPYCNNFSPTSTLPGANTWFDAGPSPVLHGIVTNYYAQASFDQFMVYGDYWPNVVSIPCTGSAWVDAQTVTNAINNGPWATANNLPKALFDQWTPTSVGDPKTHAPNGKLDAVAVIWNNHRDFAYQPSNQPDACCSGCGYGLQQMGGGADATASFNEGPGGYGFFLAEFFHGLFGGNNFHNGGGAGQHTFLVTPHTHSACGQAFATSKVANAWDRLVMGWKLPSRSSPIMAGDSSCSFDVPSDIDITTLPGGGTFCLRDYNLTGDALRIKLPHLDWHQPKTGQNQDAKNQYLILENHRLEESLLPPRYTINADILGSPANPATPGYVACMDPSKPGLYPYIQVGKDIKVGSTSDLYFAPASQPNGLGSWTFPLDAAG
ncbi:MAG TPA: CHRD domain-containing protein, partial [Gemmatimonadales bacterium]|nr:CHRD domain-containing protein [Gemmatimonadales bacterium]